jgi:hypothetical protein
MSYRIELCCNDPDNGNPLGAACAIEFSGNGQDVAGSAKVVNTLIGGGDVRMSRKVCENSCPANRYAKYVLRIGRLKVFCFEYREWFGNWCWDAAWIAGADAVGVANYLTRLKYWHCEYAPSEFFEKFNAKQLIAPEDMP